MKKLLLVTIAMVFGISGFAFAGPVTWDSAEWYVEARTDTEGAYNNQFFTSTAFLGDPLPISVSAVDDDRWYYANSLASASDNSLYSYAYVDTSNGSFDPQARAYSSFIGTVTSANFERLSMNIVGDNQSKFGLQIFDLTTTTILYSGLGNIGGEYIAITLGHDVQVTVWAAVWANLYSSMPGTDSVSVSYGFDSDSSPPPPTPVPEPSTMLLLGSGLVGMVLYRRRQVIRGMR